MKNKTLPERFNDIKNNLAKNLILLEGLSYDLDLPYNFKDELKIFNILKKQYKKISDILEINKGKIKRVKK
jgi:hypothetical protein